MSSYVLTLTPLTPVHVGTGDVIEPYEYTVLDRRLYYFKTEELLLHLEQQEQNIVIDHIASSPAKLQLFLQSKKQIVERISLFSMPVSQRAADKYQERIQSTGSDLTLYPVIKQNNVPYIPGSSLKGAIRTALLFKRIKEQGQTQDINKFTTQELEKKCFQYEALNTDPFKYIKLSDSNLLAGCTILTIVEMVTKNKNGQWGDATMPLLREVISPGFFQNRNNVFHMYLGIDDKNSRFSVQNISNACNAFYGLHFDEEAGYTTGISELRAYSKLKTMRDKLHDDKAGFIVRLGWGSGFDAVTVNYGLPTQQRQVKRSRRLVEGTIPLGWVRATFKEC